MAKPWENYSNTTAQETAAAAPWAKYSGETPTTTEAPTPATEAPTGRGEAAPVTGFWDTLENPISLIKRDSMVAHALEYLTTPSEQYKKKEARVAKEDKHLAVMSVPAMADMNDMLNQYEDKASSVGLTPQEEATYFKLQESYGSMYDAIGAAYDKGDFEAEFSFKALKDAVDKDPGGTVAEMANALLSSPELLAVPVGWEAAAGKASAATIEMSRAVNVLAKTSAGIAGASATGATIATMDEAARQLAENGRLDYEKLKNSAAVGAVAAPAVYGTLKGGAKLYKKAIEKSAVNKANKAIEKFENLVGDYRSQGLNAKNAIRQASQDMKVTHSAMKAYSVEAGRPVRFDLEKVTPEYERKVTTKLSKFYKDSFAAKALGGIQKTIDNVLTPTSTVLGKYSPRLMHKMRRFEHESMSMALNAREVAKPFIKGYRSLTKEQQKEIDYHLMFKNTNAAKDYLTSINKGDMIGDLERIEDMLDNFYQAQKAVGHNPEYVEGYFPRIVTDYKGFRRATGRADEPSIFDKELARMEKKKGHPLTDVERALVIDKLMRKGTYIGPEFGLSSVKKRKVMGGKREWLPYYANTEESLERYIQQVTHNIHRRKFFGYTAADDATADLDIDTSVGSVMDREVLEGNITNDTAMKLKPLIAARFGGGERAPAAAIQDIKNIFYMATLGNPLSAATQLGDLGIATYAHGVMNTTKGLLKPSEIKLADLGIDMAAAEFESTRKTARVLNKVLKGVGFKAIDELGKNANIQAAGKKLQAWARVNNKKGMERLSKKFQAAFTPGEYADFVESLRTGNMTHPTVKYAMFSELSDLQPVSLSEMPMMYLQHPNGRIMYMLKSFTIKQLDIIRRDAMAQIKKGNTTEGFKNLTKFTMFFTAANMSSDMLKDWITTGNVDIDNLDDRIIPNLYRNFGVSEYIVNKYGDQPMMAATQMVMPPFNIVDDVYRDAANFGQQFNSLRYVPIAGRMLYEWFGGGYEKRQEKEMLKMMTPEEYKEIQGEFNLNEMTGYGG